MRRWHLLELEDQSWFPAVVRDLATDYLQFIQTRFRLDRAMSPLVRGVMEATGERRIIDLCSGGSGPLLWLVNDLAAAGLDIQATLTDLFPNIPAFAAIAAESDGRIQFEREPVDARAVPARLTGLRTIFNGFHHFRPQDARAVLHAAAGARQPIAIFEVSERSLRTLSIVVTGASGKDIRQLFERQGALVSRVLRVSMGSLKLDKSLARGQFRQLEDTEVQALLNPAESKTSDQ